MGENEFDVIDTENQHGFNKEEAFSHGQLVMMAMKKCIEAGIKEMRQGYYNEKADKFGNINRIYVPDTRQEFVESVETCLMVMADDLEQDDPEEVEKGEEPEKTIAEKNILAIRSRLQSKYDKYCDKEKKDWGNADAIVQQSWMKAGIMFREGMLHQNFPYHFEYLMDKVRAYRNIFAELKKITFRRDYYKGEIVTG